MARRIATPTSAAHSIRPTLRPFRVPGVCASTTTNASHRRPVSSATTSGRLTTFAVAGTKVHPARLTPSAAVRMSAGMGSARRSAVRAGSYRRPTCEVRATPVRQPINAIAPRPALFASTPTRPVTIVAVGTRVRSAPRARSAAAHGSAGMASARSQVVKGRPYPAPGSNASATRTTPCATRVSPASLPSEATFAPPHRSMSRVAASAARATAA